MKHQLQLDYPLDRWLRHLDELAEKLSNVSVVASTGSLTVIDAMPGYPPGWPLCPACGAAALDGHITCGRAECNEGAWR